MLIKIFLSTLAQVLSFRFSVAFTRPVLDLQRKLASRQNNLSAYRAYLLELVRSLEASHLDYSVHERQQNLAVILSSFSALLSTSLRSV